MRIGINCIVMVEKKEIIVGVRYLWNRKLFLRVRIVWYRKISYKIITLLKKGYNVREQY